MFEVIFYYDKNDNSEIVNLIKDLSKRSSGNKDARINLKKILSYISILEQHGTMAGEPFLKKIDGELWELRPQRNRIFFFYWKDNKFVLLHHFIKKTQKTPVKEIEKAQNNLRDFKERNDKK